MASELPAQQVARPAIKLPWQMPAGADAGLPSVLYTTLLNLLIQRDAAGQPTKARPSQKDIGEAVKIARILLDMEQANRDAAQPFDVMLHEHRIKLTTIEQEYVQQLEEGKAELAETQARLLKQAVDVAIDGKYPADQQLTKGARVGRNTTEALELVAIELAVLEAEEAAGQVAAGGDDAPAPQDVSVQPPDSAPPATGVSAA